MKKNGSSQTPEILLLSNSLTFWEPCWTILPELTRRYEIGTGNAPQAVLVNPKIMTRKIAPTHRYNL